jgi:hypothetical protein
VGIGVSYTFAVISWANYHFGRVNLSIPLYGLVSISDRTKILNPFILLAHPPYLQCPHCLHISSILIEQLPGIFKTLRLVSSTNSTEFARGKTENLPLDQSTTVQRIYHEYTTMFNLGNSTGRLFLLNACPSGV